MPVTHWLSLQPTYTGRGILRSGQSWNTLCTLSQWNKSSNKPEPGSGDIAYSNTPTHSCIVCRGLPVGEWIVSQYTRMKGVIITCPFCYRVFVYTVIVSVRAESVGSIVYTVYATKMGLQREKNNLLLSSEYSLFSPQCWSMFVTWVIPTANHHGLLL